MYWIISAWVGVILFKFFYYRYYSFITRSVVFAPIQDRTDSFIRYYFKNLMAGWDEDTPNVETKDQDVAILIKRYFDADKKANRWAYPSIWSPVIEFEQMHMDFQELVSEVAFAYHATMKETVESRKAESEKPFNKLIEDMKN